MGASPTTTWDHMEYHVSRKLSLLYSLRAKLSHELYSLQESSWLINQLEMQWFWTAFPTFSYFPNKSTKSQSIFPIAFPQQITQSHSWWFYVILTYPVVTYCHHFPSWHRSRDFQGFPALFRKQAPEKSVIVQKRMLQFPAFSLIRVHSPFLRESYIPSCNQTWWLENKFHDFPSEPTFMARPCFFPSQPCLIFHQRVSHFFWPMNHC